MKTVDVYESCRGFKHNPFFFKSNQLMGIKMYKWDTFFKKWLIYSGMTSPKKSTQE